MKKLLVDKYNILFIDEEDKVSKFELLSADILVLNVTDEEQTISMIEFIRSHQSETIRLKPVLLHSLISIRSNYLQCMADGIISSEHQVEDHAEKVESTINRANQLFPMDDDYAIEESEALTKILRYMYTRNWTDLSPIRNRNFKLGFVYPVLSNNISKYDEHKISGLLKNAVLEGIFSETFVERIYLCNFCHDSFIQYRETCPKCTSSNLEEEELIHHFRCATIAPAKKFKVGNTTTLECPKCSKELRHIGIDYDKPSVMYSCKSCASSFQDYRVMAKCTNCENDSDVEYLVPETISSYKLTAKGEHIARKGIKIAYTPDVKWELVQIESANRFRETYKEYQSRLKSGTLTNFYAGVIYIIGFDDLKKLTGKDYFLKLTNEVFSLISMSLDPLKTHIFENESSLFFITSEYTYNELNSKISNLIVLLEKLVNNSTTLSEKLDLEHTLIEIKHPMDVDELLVEMTKQ
jgi:hypothetical protein